MSLMQNRLITEIVKFQLSELGIEAKLRVTLLDDAHKVSLTGVLTHDAYKADWSLDFEVTEGDVSDVVYAMPMFDIAGEIPTVAFTERERSVSDARKQIAAANDALKKHQNMIAATSAFALEFNEEISGLLDLVYVQIGNELGW